MNELKPCPFCGSEAAISYNTRYNWQVFCTNNNCFMNEALFAQVFHTEEEAEKAWNKRTIVTKYDKYTFNG